MDAQIPKWPVTRSLQNLKRLVKCRLASCARYYARLSVDMHQKDEREKKEKKKTGGERKRGGKKGEGEDS